jgi:hypothetical protein
LRFVAGCDDKLRVHYRNVIFGRGGADIFSTDDRSRGSLKRGDIVQRVCRKARVTHR